MMQLTLSFNKVEALTVLSFGAGQDSTLLLYKLTEDPAFRARYVVGTWIVVMAATGNEHDHTIEHVHRVAHYCMARSVPFYYVDPQMGFHAPQWQSLVQFYRDNQAIGSKAYPKSCTDQLKIGPIYRFLEWYLAQQHHTPIGRKRGFYEFQARGGRLRMLIGIAADEAADRLSDGPSGPLWMQRTVEKVYPLVEMGYTRADCQREIAAMGHEVPWPSNCQFCPFASKQELLWLYHRYPDRYAEWVQLEAAKLRKWAHLGDKNLGVWGRKTLPEVLEEAEAEFGHMSLADLDEYKFSHGHCVRSKY